MKNLLLGILIILVISVIVFLIVKCFKKDNFEEILEPIPKVIHKVIIEHSGNLPKFPLEPKELQEAHDSWKKMNPEYQIKYYSTNDCREYLKKHFKDSDFLQAFDCLNANAFKCDFFRYCVLCNEGGWYSDWKQVCLKQNLLNELDKNKKNNIIISWDKGEIFASNNDWIQNCFIGSIKNSLFLKECINTIINNIKYNYYGKFALDATSPGLLSYIFKKTDYKFHINLVFKNLNIYNNSGTIIKHKCNNCGINQDWKNGNNYNDIYNKKIMYNNFIIKNKIPKVIYKTGPFKLNDLPDNIKTIFNKTKEYNNDYKLEYYDDNDCINFIKKNFNDKVLWAYNKLKPTAYKADLFRYCLLYIKGGIYSDLTQEFLVPLNTIIDYNKDTLVLGDDFKYEEHNFKGIQINFIATIPNQSIFMNCINQIIKNCLNQYYGKTQLDVTGPILFRKILNSTYINYIIKFRYTHKFLVDNNEKNIIKVRCKKHHDILYNNKPTYYSMWKDKQIYE